MNEEPKVKETQEQDKLPKIREGLKAKKSGLRPLDPRKLKEWDMGLRNGDEDQVEAMAQDMREQGYRNEFPVIVDMSTGEIISGIMRHRAAVKAEISRIPCVCYEQLEPEERIVLASDDGLFKAKKSPMALIRQLHLIHETFKFSYRDMEQLMGISKSIIDRKLAVLKVSKSLQDLYEKGMIGETDIEHIRKKVSNEHYDAVAEKINEAGEKVSGKELKAILSAYKHALEKVFDKIKAGEPTAKLEINVKEEADLQRESARQEFYGELEQHEKLLRDTDYNLVTRPEEELNRLERQLEVIRESIRRLCAKLGKEPTVLSREEEIEILASRMSAKRPARAATAAPSVVAEFERPEPRAASKPPLPAALPASKPEPSTDHEEAVESSDDPMADTEGLWAEKGISKEEMEETLRNEPPSPLDKEAAEVPDESDLGENAIAENDEAA